MDPPCEVANRFQEVARGCRAESQELGRLLGGELAGLVHADGGWNQLVLDEHRRKLPHALGAVAALRVYGWIVEEDPILSRVELLADDELLVLDPVGVVHARGLVLPAVPRRQRLALGVLLPPLRRWRLETRAKFGGPVFVERVEVDDRGCANVPDDETDAGPARPLVVRLSVAHQ